MSFFDSLMVSVFSIALVFLVLAVLYSMVLGFSKVLSGMQKGTVNQPAFAESAVQLAETIEEESAPGYSAGELKLHGVDEKTAAMIMAIVSHETRTPLSELCFKSIKAIES